MICQTLQYFAFGKGGLNSKAHLYGKPLTALSLPKAILTDRATS
jgi:hypothetical protein